MVYKWIASGFGRAEEMMENGSIGWNIVVRVDISGAYGAVVTFRTGLSRRASSISSGAVSTGLAEVVTEFAMILESAMASQCLG